MTPESPSAPTIDASQTALPSTRPADLTRPHEATLAPPGQTSAEIQPLKPARKKMGRPRKNLTPQQIEDLEALAMTGATRQEQAAMLGMDEDTLSRRLRDQPEVFMALARAGAKMRTSLRRKQLAIAMNDRHQAQATMLVWLGKTMLGQTERINLKIETASDALEKLRQVWPEIPEDDLIRQLTEGAIDVEGVPVEEPSGERDEDEMEATA